MVRRRDRTRYLYAWRINKHFASCDECSWSMQRGCFVNSLGGCAMEPFEDSAQPNDLKCQARSPSQAKISVQFHPWHPTRNSRMGWRYATEIRLEQWIMRISQAKTAHGTKYTVSYFLAALHPLHVAAFHCSSSIRRHRVGQKSVYAWQAQDVSTLRHPHRSTAEYTSSTLDQ